MVRAGIGEDESHIRVTKKAYKKFMKIGSRDERNIDVFESIVDFYFSNRNKPRIVKRPGDDYSHHEEEEANNDNDNKDMST